MYCTALKGANRMGRGYPRCVSVPSVIFGFVLSQTHVALLNLIKFVKKKHNVYDTKLVLLNGPLTYFRSILICFGIHRF